MNVQNNISTLEYCLLSFLLVLMPLHYYICEILLRDIKFDNVLRDIIIILLVGLTLVRNRWKINKNGLFIALICIVLVSFASVSYVVQNIPGTWNVLRTYMVPMLIYYVSSKIKLNRKQFDKIHRLIVYELAIISVYGFFQAFFLGDQFLIALGYPSFGGNLSATSYYINGFFGYQRSVGTFVSPNTCGVLLSFAMCILIFGDFGINHRKKNILMIMLGIGLLATFSRTAIFGLLISMFVMYIYKYKKKVNKKKLYKIFLIVILLSGMVLMIDRFFLGGLFMRMLNSSISGMFLRTDASTVKHLEDLVEPLEMVLSHPFGLWFGKNGPMAIEVVSFANTVESSIYLMLYEVGLFFGLMYFIPYIKVIIHTVKNKSKYCIAASISLVSLITFLFLPNVQTYEILFYIFFFIGLYDNYYVGES